MENITFNELLSIIEDKGLNMTWCNHDNWTVNRALGYIEGLEAMSIRYKNKWEKYRNILQRSTCSKIYYSWIICKSLFCLSSDN